MKRVLISAVIIFVIAIGLQLAWNEMFSGEKETSEKGFFEKLFTNDGTKKGEKASGQDNASDLSEIQKFITAEEKENSVDLTEKIKDMLAQGEDVYLPKLDDPDRLYSIRLNEAFQPGDIDINFTYRSELEDNGLIFLNIQKRESASLDIMVEDLENTIPIDYKGFKGSMGQREDIEDEIQFVVEKDDIYFSYSIYTDLDKDEWEDFYEDQLAMLEKDEDHLMKVLQFAEEHRTTFAYPYVTDELEGSYYTSLERHDETGTLLQMSYYLSSDKNFSYNVYFSKNKAKHYFDLIFIDEYGTETLETSSGQSVEKYSYDSASYQMVHYVWEMDDGKMYEISLIGEEDKQLVDEEVLYIVDTVSQQE